MKLKNKKTGEIIEKFPDVFVVNSGEWIRHYDSLAELNAEWEDAPEEPKEHWAIDQFGEPINVTGLSRLQLEKLHQLGNGFETKEEAQKAAEKLKAWERLQKKFNFHITGWDVVDTQVIITTDCDFDYVKARQDDGLWSDLDLVFNGNLLFGGKK